MHRMVNEDPCICMLSFVRLFVTPCAAACQTPLSMGFPKQENWSGLPFPTPGDLPNPGIQSLSLVSISCIDRQILYHCLRVKINK